MLSETISFQHIREFFLTHGIDICAAEPYRNGVASTNFAVTSCDGDSLTLRCDSRRSLELVRQDRLFSELARRVGISTPVGPWYEGKIDGIASVARPTLSGQTLDDLAIAAWPDVATMGAQLASLHRSPKPATHREFFYQALLTGEPTKWTQLREAGSALVDIPHAREAMETAWSRISKLGQTDIGQLNLAPTTLIHGDFTPSNILSEHGDIKVLDWEKACLGPMYADIVQALYYFSSRCAQVPGCSAKTFCRQFLASYCKVVALDNGLLKAWLHYFPSFIVLVDAANAVTNRSRRSSGGFSQRREDYFAKHSLPRFRYYASAEADVIECVNVVETSPASAGNMRSAD